MLCYDVIIWFNICNTSIMIGRRTNGGVDLEVEINESDGTTAFCDGSIRYVRKIIEKQAPLLVQVPASRGGYVPIKLTPS